jgi:hypothetical protein
LSADNLSDSTREVTVPRPAPNTLEAAKLNAEARFRELMDELRLLTVSFPHLRDAFDPEDLPIAFLLKRGADRAARRPSRATKRLAKRTDRTRTTKKIK